jgi:lipopolysaccharide export system permease protein
MIIIRKLIINEWIRFFLAAVSLLLMLLSVGNLISGFLRGNVSHSEVLLNYLINVPDFLTQVIPISCLVASLFSINKLKNRNELTAIFASGYSRQSFVIDLIIVSSVIALFQFTMSAYIAPIVKSKRFDLLESSVSKFRNLKSQGLSSSTIGSGKIWYKSDTYYFSFTHFTPRDNTLHNVTIYNLDNNYKVKSIDIAPKVIYDLAQKRWVTPIQTEYSNLNNPSFPIFNNELKTVSINETIDDFKQIEADITTLNFFRLYSYISQLGNSGININEYMVVFYQHISDSLICIIFALIAAIPIFNPNRRSSSFGKSASLVFVFTILYWLIQTYFIELGKNLKVIPFVACFLIPIIFLFFIISVFYKNRNLA